MTSLVARTTICIQHKITNSRVNLVLLKPLMLHHFAVNHIQIRNEKPARHVRLFRRTVLCYRPFSRYSALWAAWKVFKVIKGKAECLYISTTSQFTIMSINDQWKICINAGNQIIDQPKYNHQPALSSQPLRRSKQWTKSTVFVARRNQNQTWARSTVIFSIRYANTKVSRQCQTTADSLTNSLHQQLHAIFMWQHAINDTTHTEIAQYAANTNNAAAQTPAILSSR